MTVYYVLNQLGPHSKGDVLSFSPEQIGAGVDITHLTSVGAIRVATPLIDPPSAPTLATAGSGGTVLAGVYTVKISYVTAVGETTPSSSATITTSGTTSTLTVTSPAPSTGATGWYASVSQVGGSTLTRQQTAPTPIGTNLVLTAPPTSSGPAPLGTNTSGEAARAVPAQIQATHAPQGVGVFTSNGVPDSTTYAGIAAYGSLCWNVAVSPPAIYVNTGTIAAPTWTASGGIPGLTSDGQDGAVTEGNLTVGGDAHVFGEFHARTAITELLTSLGAITAPAFNSIPSDHDGHIGGNDALYALATTQQGDVATATVYQRIPSGVSISALSIVTMNLTGGPSVPLATALAFTPSLFFVPDSGSNTPDFSGGFGSFSFTTPTGAVGVGPDGPSSFGFELQAPIDHSWWLGVFVAASAPYSPLVSLDAASGTTVLTYAGVNFDGSDAVSVGNKTQIYGAYASDRGFRFSARDNTLMGTMTKTGFALPTMLGENGKTPPASPSSITGNVTTGDLAALQTVVGQLLTALDAKGSITKSTT